jgi:hypothetical protein
MILDFARAWRDPFLALFALDEIENSPLPVGQHVYDDRPNYREGKFK